MEKIATLVALALMAATLDTARAEDPKSPLDFTLKSIDGTPVQLSTYKGKVVLLVNVASQCGLTPQYKGLESLYKKYQDQGLVVLGIPANEFGAQEPGTDEEILKFCKGTYNVDFPLFSKVVVKGNGIAPLYDYLTNPATDPKFAGPISWNFEKFLIGRDGQIVGRFKPKTTPGSAEVVSAIEAELAKK